MSSIFNFHGQTTFIDQPKDVVIKNFQNQFIAGDNQQANQINAELISLIELILQSGQIKAEDKEASVAALHTMAADVTSDKVNKATFKTTLNSIKDITTKA